MNVCGSCGAPIEWATVNKTGKSMPIDPEPSPGGNVRVIRRVEHLDNVALTVEVVSGPSLLDPDEPLHTSHFATCPQADEWRKR